jgi:hypothetical protein
MQYDWPKETGENPEGSPFLAAAGCIRGFCDTVYYLIEIMLLWIADLLEAADFALTKTLGPKYWLNKEFEETRKKTSTKCPMRKSTR